MEYVCTREQNQVEDSNSSLQYSLPTICHGKIIFDIWQHSFKNRSYLLQSIYESKIKNAVGRTRSKSQLYAFSQ